VWDIEKFWGLFYRVGTLSHRNGEGGLGKISRFLHGGVLEKFPDLFHEEKMQRTKKISGSVLYKEVE
jgi:hypothetical protein